MKPVFQKNPVLTSLILKLKVYVKAVPSSRIVRNVGYKIKISDVNPQPGSQTSASWSWTTV